MIEQEQQQNEQRTGEGIRFDDPPEPDAWQPGDDSGEVVGKAADLMPRAPEGEEPEPAVEEPERAEPAAEEIPPRASDGDEEDAREAEHHVAQEAARADAETDVGTSGASDNGNGGSVEVEPEPESSSDRQYRIALSTDEGNTEVFIGNVIAKNTEGAFRKGAKLKDDKDEYILADGTHDLIATPTKYRTSKSVACGPRSSERGVRVG